MNEKDKIFQIMNRAIDGEAGARERRRLGKYMTQHPEASQIYDELKGLVSMLRVVPSRVPSPLVKQRIMNEIPRFAVSMNRSLKLGIASRFTLMTRLRPSLAFAGAGTIGGLVLGVLLSVFLYPRPDLLETYGTIASVDNRQNSRSVLFYQQIEGPGVTGTIDAGRVGNGIDVNIHLNTTKQSDLVVRFNPADIEVAGVHRGAGESAGFQADSQSLRISTIGESNFLIQFKEKSPQLTRLDCSIIQGGRGFWQQDFETR